MSTTRHTCVTCPSWLPNDPHRPEDMGACRDSGPTPLLVGFQNSALSGQPDMRKPITISAWGITGPLDWCFAHPGNRAEQIRSMPMRRAPKIEQGASEPLPLSALGKSVPDAD